MASEVTRFYPWSLEELRELPAPTWLVEDVIPAGGLAVVYGQTGHGKTFVMLDLALCLATGQPWHGHDTTQGTVVYVCAEGARSVWVRAAAWEQSHQRKAGPFFVVREAVSLMDALEVRTLQEAITGKELRPTLLVFDTWPGVLGTATRMRPRT